MNEELDSQLSAMFDDELPEAECQLLARRLSRDEALQARWGRYAVIGATIRAERDVRLDANLARRVRASIVTEPLLSGSKARRPPRWLQPLAGLAVAAGVATVSIMWLRESSVAPSVVAPLLSQVVAPGSALPAAPMVSDRAATYVVPPAAQSFNLLVPPTELANYVVAHSEFSTPVTRRNLLSELVSGESGTAGSSGESHDAAKDPNNDADQAP